MVEKEHLENFLRLNGISPTAPDEEIRSALITAKWHDTDVEVALMVLRGEKGGEDIEMIASRQLFHSDAHIAPETLSKLLGMHVQIGRNQLRASYNKADADRKTAIFYTWLTIASVLGAGLLALFLMYSFQVGPFYAAAEVFAL